jgi:hypothetical protein
MFIKAALVGAVRPRGKANLGMIFVIPRSSSRRLSELAGGLC